MTASGLPKHKVGTLGAYRARTATCMHGPLGATDASSAPLYQTRRRRGLPPSRCGRAWLFTEVVASPRGRSSWLPAVSGYRDGLQRCARWDEAGETYPNARSLAMPCWSYYYSRYYHGSRRPWGPLGRSDCRTERSLYNRRVRACRSPWVPCSPGPWIAGHMGMLTMTTGVAICP